MKNVVCDWNTRPLVAYLDRSTLTLFEVLTMSSLEMVSYINDTRKPGEGALTHNNFMAKVQKVLGATANSFEAAVNYTIGQGAKREQKIYSFPKREAMLMAMSYSYELQAQVFDAWEVGIKNVYLPLGYIPLTLLI